MVTNKKSLVLQLTDRQLGDLIRGYVDFDSIVHFSPNILRDPIDIRHDVVRTLEDIGLSVKEGVADVSCRSVRLECSDVSGVYYILCYILSESEGFVILVGHLHKAVENIDPFSAESDIELTSEQVKNLNKENINKIMNNNAIVR